jgi:DNA (cytosine-5)-methyltransferase 1
MAYFRIPTVVDLFCGVGGLSLGAARAGFRVACGIDNDAIALKAHSMNFPASVHLNEDVSMISGNELLASLDIRNEDLDGLIGGPPCQGFSTMGHRDSGDPRNLLFSHFFRLVGECKPRFFLAENVPGIMNTEYDKVREAAFSYVADHYKTLPPMSLSASDFGAPTTRKRVFFVGYLNETVEEMTEQDFAPPDGSETVNVRKALTGLPLKIKPSWIRAEDGWRKVRNGENGHFGERLYGTVPDGAGDPYALKALQDDGRVSGCLGTRHSEPVLQRYAKVQQGKHDPVSKSVRLVSEGFCPTLRAGTGRERGSFQAVRPLHPTENRVITPREAARLQGFPDWFRFDGTKWHSFRQIGGSVSPLLAERLFEVIKGKLI